MKIPFTRTYFPSSIRNKINKDIDKILFSGILMMGPFQKKLEKEFQTLSNTKYAVTINSATTGLQIALRFANCKGKEVLVPAASFLTDVSAILMEGGIPVLVDCDEDTLSFDLKDLKKKIGPKTAAIIWVHLTGYISEEYLKIQKLAKKNSILLIEDSSHSHGAEIDGIRAGNLGDCGVFSLYPTKILTSGSGGVLTTNNYSLAKYAKELRLFGKNEQTGEVIHLGNDWFLDEIRCCVAYHQVKNINLITKKRRKAASIYLNSISNFSFIKTYSPRAGHYPGWYQFPLLLNNEKLVNLSINYMKKLGIECKRIYRPIVEEKIFKNYFCEKPPKAHSILQRSLCLPMMTDISLQEISKVSNSLNDFLKSQKN